MRNIKDRPFAYQFISFSMWMALILTLIILALNLLGLSS